MAKEVKRQDTTTLFLYTEKLRLDRDKYVMEEKLQATQRIEANGSIFDKAKAAVKNKYNKFISSAGSYEQKNKAIIDEINRFNANNPKAIDEAKASEELKQLVGQDKTGTNQLMFDLSVILDNKYKYTYLDDGLMAVSSYLHSQDDYLLNLKDDLESIYKVIADDKSLSLKQMGILAGVSLATILACIIVPLSAPTVTAGSAAATTFLIGTALVGGTYIGMKEYNKEEIRKQFRKLTPDELAMELSIQILCIKHLRMKLNSDEFKDRLNLILEELNTLKADLDYYLFVERQDIDSNKRKLHIFHGFDKCLEEALGI
ncbi:MAG: hypothetical protein MJ206_02250 [Bacilli bacterium]|nr:hypothetical protein [Bacilli bacterium]